MGTSRQTVRSKRSKQRWTALESMVLGPAALFENATPIARDKHAPLLLLTIADFLFVIAFADAGFLFAPDETPDFIALDRMLRRFTRLTNAHSKSWPHHKAAIGLLFAH
jgi:hypothetical protein